MNRIIKKARSVSLLIPCVLSLTGCNKDNRDKIETWDGTVGEVSEAVDGIITIDTAEELAGLAKKVNEGTNYSGYTIKLAVDMDLKNREWMPIGYGSVNLK